MISIICGLPGVGKSTLAKMLAPRINATVISSDEIRKDLFPNPTYSAFERKLVYDIMILVAKYLQVAHVSCILDATFNRENSRIEIKEKLNLENEQFIIIECVCSEEIAISRLESRKDDYSDATVEVYHRMKRIYEPVKTDHILVDTALPTKENVQKITDRIRNSGQI